MKQEENEIVVTVCCVTYNHEKYIRQSLESLLNQNTTFPYEILIHDDASTDQTISILKEYKNKYPNKIRLMLEENNQYSQGNRIIIANIMFSSVVGKYVAICEGDDYWSDKNKLQMQYEIMEKNSSLAVCVHRTEIINEEGKRTGRYLPAQMENDQILDGQQYVRQIFTLDSHLFHTSSLFFSMKSFEKDREKLPEYFSKAAVEDRMLLMYLGLRGNVYYIGRTMSCYRIMSVGSWSSMVSNSKEAYYKNDLEIREMLKSFNIYSEGKLKEEIYQYETIVMFRILQYEMKGKQLRQERYRKLYDNLKTKEKLWFYICAYFPWIGKGYRMIKGKIKGEKNVT